MGQQSSTHSSSDENPWFKLDLSSKKYEDFGDAYNDNRYKALCEEWDKLEPECVDRSLIIPI
jgi:hypothetical protein